jgi:hypothetical protein
MFKLLKEKLLNAITVRPRLLTFGIRLAITLGIGSAIGLVDFNHLSTYAVRPQCIGCALLRTATRNPQHCIGC